MIIRILFAYLILLIVPFGYGSLLTYRYKRIEKTDFLFVYASGFCLFYALFSCIAIPMTIVRSSFHEVRTVFILLSGISIVFILVRALRETLIADGTLWFHTIKRVVRKYWWILLPAGIILSQILRSVIRMNSVYSDDDSYMPVILDMIKTDTLLGTDAITGELHNNSYTTYANPKLLLTAWLQFLAAFSSMIGLHPLILVKSALPVFFIGIHYLVIWKLTFFLSTDNYKRIGVLFFYTLLMEFGSPSLNTDLSYYLFTWNWYGKSVLQFMVIPLIMLFFLMIRKVQTGWREGVILLILVSAGISLSSMGLILLTIEVMAFIFVECLEKHSVRDMWVMVPAFVPIIVYAMMYYTMF